MSLTHAELITQFYTAFKNRDYATMAACYHPDVEFSDPVFTDLKRKHVSAMWHMLVSAGKETKVTFSDVRADGNEGSCNWEARYPYGEQKRPVHNVIHSTFEFRDGKIVKQTDVFDLRRWLGMALGPVGQLLGWTGFLNGKVRKIGAVRLQKFLESHPEYRS